MSGKMNDTLNIHNESIPHLFLYLLILLEGCEMLNNSLRRALTFFKGLMCKSRLQAPDVASCYLLQ